MDAVETAEARGREAAGRAAAGRGLPGRRLLSVDVLRGLCVAGMVLVNFPADWVLRYRQLGHAEWNGATATDMIFPEFLLLSGFSMVYSFAARSGRGATRGQLGWHVVWRSLVLLALGLGLNAVPAMDWRTLHVFGVLQRIALCTLVGGLVVLGSARRRGGTLQVNAAAVGAAAVCVWVLLWAAMRFVPVPGYGSWRFDPEGNLGAVVDRAVFGTAHLSDWGGPRRLWDADGLISSAGSIPNFLVGVLTALWVRRGRPVAGTVAGMAGCGGALVAVALLLDRYLVINRKLWTGSFSLLSSGVSLLVFAVLYGALDGGGGAEERRGRWWLRPLLVYGSNAMLGFVLYSLLLVVHAHTAVVGSHAPAFWLPGPMYGALRGWLGARNLSLLYGMGAVALVLGMLWPFYERRIFWKL